ncbi:MAG: FAD-dependent oxidoreductase [Dehalococcoidales bacterium]|nr:FAD-dependent oxidoreductase [Dehalococcoidales bacterium]
MANRYDVVIVGAGPAGMFAALELSRKAKLSILLVDKGEDIDRRSDVTSGFGGAGAFSDGKLTLSPLTGGQLRDYIGEENTRSLIKYVDEVYLGFGAPDKLYGTGDEIEELKSRASLEELRLITVPLRHMGTERCRSVIRAIRAYLNSSIEIKLNTMVSRVIIAGGKVQGVEIEDGQQINCEYLILAPGREGSDWLLSQANQLAMTMYSNPVDLGIRVEVPQVVMKKLTDCLYEAKLEYLSRSFDDRIRTFCMCPGGEVIIEKNGGADPIITVNGHSYADRQTGNTNFALLVSTRFTEPFHEPIAYGKYLAKLANILSGGVLVQRLGDLLAGRRSTPSRIERGLVIPTLTEATPGDLSFVLPYRQLTGLVEMLLAMDRLAPGVASRHTLLYGLEVKFYSSRPELSVGLETEIGGMFTIGDGAGISRGLIQASVSGVVAAREILNRISGRNA